jgi:hypothetical protein
MLLCGVLAVPAVSAWPVVVAAWATATAAVLAAPRVE